MGLVRGVRATEDLLAASGEGAVLTISSTAALEHFGPGPTSYSALKAAATVLSLIHISEPTRRYAIS